MTPPLFTSDHGDALQEIVNIAMGKAGSSLAQILGVFVRLSVPRIRVVEAARAAETLTGMVGSDKEVTAVRQSFLGALRGEAIVIYDRKGCADLADLTGYEGEFDAAAEKELLLDIGNVLTGACLCGIFEQLDMELGFSPPSLMAEHAYVETLLSPEDIAWSHALVVEVNFTLEQRNFTCHLITLMPEESIEKMRLSLEQFIASL